MSRIAATFQRLREARRKALIPYFTAGDPDRAATVPVMRALAMAGADIIELGVPFSDPMADGPTIQRASERALRRGTSLSSILEDVRRFRETDGATPIVLMGYANPIEAMGVEAFAERARTSGVDGVLVVDYPPEESQELCQAMGSRGMDVIFLVAPTTTETRMREIANAARGYIYYVSLTGVTGARHIDLAAVEQKLARLRGMTTLPIGVGFGIRDGETARAVASFADAVVIGSALVERMEAVGGSGAAQCAADFVGAIREAMDAR
ncbi:MAG: tryptophan synthase subunit alpha [Betaproteobacteria bacterium]|nr:MAG: tryptophan synthase subunit alpha [Betaproteobacteria bacterium]